MPNDSSQERLLPSEGGTLDGAEKEPFQGRRGKLTVEQTIWINDRLPVYDKKLACVNGNLWDDSDLKEWQETVYEEFLTAFKESLVDIDFNIKKVFKEKFKNRRSYLMRRPATIGARKRKTTEQSFPLAKRKRTSGYALFSVANAQSVNDIVTRTREEQGLASKSIPPLFQQTASQLWRQLSHNDRRYWNREAAKTVSAEESCFTNQKLFSDRISTLLGAMQGWDSHQLGESAHLVFSAFRQQDGSIATQFVDVPGTAKGCKAFATFFPHVRTSFMEAFYEYGLQALPTLPTHFLTSNPPQAAPPIEERDNTRSGEVSAEPIPLHGSHCLQRTPPRNHPNRDATSAAEDESQSGLEDAAVPSRESPESEDDEDEEEPFKGFDIDVSESYDETVLSPLPTPYFSIDDRTPGVRVRMPSDEEVRPMGGDSDDDEEGGNIVQGFEFLPDGSQLRARPTTPSPTGRGQLQGAPFRSKTLDTLRIADPTVESGEFNLMEEEIISTPEIRRFEDTRRNTLSEGPGINVLETHNTPSTTESPVTDSLDVRPHSIEEASCDTINGLNECTEPPTAKATFFNVFEIPDTTYSTISSASGGHEAFTRIPEEPSFGTISCSANDGQPPISRHPDVQDRDVIDSSSRGDDTDPSFTREQDVGLARGQDAQASPTIVHKVNTRDTSPLKSRQRRRASGGPKLSTTRPPVAPEGIVEGRRQRKLTSRALESGLNLSQFKPKH